MRLVPFLTPSDMIVVLRELLGACIALLWSLSVWISPLL